MIVARHEVPGYLANGKIVSLPNKYPLPFHNNRRHLIRVISRPFRARRRGAGFPGLKPWANPLAPPGRQIAPKSSVS
jgi:hypothetical protein